MAEVFQEAAVKKIFVGDAEFCHYLSLASALQDGDPSHKVYYLLPGYYQENVRLYGKNIQIIGLGEVVIDADLSAWQKDSCGEPLGTFRTATFFANGENIHLQNLTIRNSAGPGEAAGQAIALYLEGTKITVENCRLQGYQDTLCVGPLPEKNKQGLPMTHDWLAHRYQVQDTVFRQCVIEGTVDFIFGGGNAVFQQCILKALARANPKDANYLTAASTPANQQGLLFQNCAVFGQQKYFLGRPWRPDAATSFIECFFDEQLAEKGWDDWGNPDNRSTARYRETNCRYHKPPKRDLWIDFTAEGENLV